MRDGEENFDELVVRMVAGLAPKRVVLENVPAARMVSLVDALAPLPCIEFKSVGAPPRRRQVQGDSYRAMLGYMGAGSRMAQDDMAALYRSGGAPTPLSVRFKVRALLFGAPGPYRPRLGILSSVLLRLVPAPAAAL